MPASPASPQTYSHTYGSQGGVCGDALGDGTGVLALHVAQDPEPSTYRFISATGSEIGSAPMRSGLLFQQPNRYVGLVYDGAGQNRVEAVDEHGGRGGGTAVYGDGSALWPDPNGGLFVAGVGATANPTPKQVWMFEQNGSTRWGPTSLGADAAIVGISVDVLGRALVITAGGGTVNAIWYERNGTRMTDFFPIATNFTPGPSTWFEGAPLIGGGLAIRRVDAPSSGARTGWHSKWMNTIASGSANVQPAPDWLSSRNDTWLQPARGNKAYAVLPMQAQGTNCDQKVDVFAPTGTPCGTLDFPIAQGTCDTFDLRMGLDGTVLQKLPASLEQTQSSDVRSCTLRFWPALLK